MTLSIRRHDEAEQSEMSVCLCLYGPPDYSARALDEVIIPFGSYLGASSLGQCMPRSKCSGYVNGSQQSERRALYHDATGNILCSHCASWPLSAGLALSTWEQKSSSQDFTSCNLRPTTSRGRSIVDADPSLPNVSEPLVMDPLRAASCRSMPSSSPLVEIENCGVWRYFHSSDCIVVSAKLQ